MARSLAENFLSPTEKAGDVWLGGTGEQEKPRRDGQVVKQNG